MIAKIKEITAKIKKEYGEIYRKGTKEYQDGSVDSLTQAYLLLTLIDEVKALREDIKGAKVEEPKKVETPKAQATKTK